MGSKLVSIPKEQICQGKLNKSLLILTHTRIALNGDYLCSLYNGHIMRRSQMDNVMPFLDENRRVWTENCSNTVWTDIANETNLVRMCEFYNAASKSFSKTSCDEPKCFICVLGDKRSFYQMKLTWKPLDQQRIVSFTLKNDPTGNLVFVGNEGDRLVQGSPLKIYDTIGSIWRIIAQKPDTWFIPGVNDFLIVNESGIATNEILQTKLSNVSKL